MYKNERKNNHNRLNLQRLFHTNKWDFERKYTIIKSQILLINIDKGTRGHMDN